MVKLMKLKKSILFLFCILIGLLISIQSRVITGTFHYISPEILKDYDNSIKTERMEIEQLKILISEKQEKLKAYQSYSGESDSILNTMTQELNRMRLISGFLDVQGEGVIILLDDGTRDLYQGENPNDILVHDIDLLTIINDLKIAGAEAISINGQRLINNSEINCSGHSVRINNQFFAQPFIIKAIGDPKILHSSLSAPGSYGELLREYGLILNVDKSINIRISKYSEESNYKFLKTVEEGEMI